MLVEDAGLLVPPKSPQAIAEALVSLLLNPTKRTAFGMRARSRVLESYNRDRIGSVVEEAFKAACQREAVVANKTVCCLET